jgi:hypothetical protein
LPTPFENAQLNLQLFDLRREPVLRAARAWFLLEFNPESLEDLVTLVSGERNAAFRMVLGYWDMAASLVTTGAIDGDAFRPPTARYSLHSVRFSPGSPKFELRAPSPTFANT